MLRRGSNAMGSIYSPNAMGSSYDTAVSVLNWDALRAAASDVWVTSQSVLVEPRVAAAMRSPGGGAGDDARALAALELRRGRNATESSGGSAMLDKSSLNAYHDDAADVSVNGRGFHSSTSQLNPSRV